MSKRKRKNKGSNLIGFLIPIFFNSSFVSGNSKSCNFHVKSIFPNLIFTCRFVSERGYHKYLSVL